MERRTVLVGGLVAAAVAVTAPPAAASDTPPAPRPVRPGYTLDFAEEFDGTTLDPAVWLDYYLPHWAPVREHAKCRYGMANGVLTQRIDWDQPKWRGDRQQSRTVCSSIQTYNANNWHRFNSNVVLRPEPTFHGYTFKYGYVELRAKLNSTGGGGHQALWLVGVEDTAESSNNAEIDMLETFFSHTDEWYLGALRWDAPDFSAAAAFSSHLPASTVSSEFHDYGMEWTPTQLKFYFDGELKHTVNDAPNSRMGIILSIYVGAGSGEPNDVWPKQWQIEHLRVWKDDRGYDTYKRFENRDDPSQVMHVANRNETVQVGSAPSTYWSAHWWSEPTPDGHVRYRNRWTNEYLDDAGENGLAHTTAAVTAASSQWIEEKADVHYLRFRNRLTGRYLHTEGGSGSVHVGEQAAGYWRSHWLPVPVR
jgi:hypothetical protein